MCGFVGFINNNDKKDKENNIKKMMDTIVHRGPDSEGTYIDEDVALGFRRLSIIGLENGDQPMSNETNDIELVFNGEIYNYKAIKSELEKEGYVFRTSADTEVLIHLYEKYGPTKEMLNQLRGMFAFVIWDKAKKRLFGARDYFGIKPLYYAKMKDMLMFGSEIKSFLPHPHFKKEFNDEALAAYICFQYSALEETFFKNVFKLKPAHYFIYENNELNIERYWEPKFLEENKSIESFVEEIHETFQDSIKAHKVSDVEVGSFLSSGIDSSYVTACLRPQKTYTVGFDFSAYDEGEYAKNLAAYLNIDNEHKLISEDEFWDVLPKIQYHMDEPLADAAAIALYFVSGIAAKDLKVVLSGEGADELFGGYNIYTQPPSFVGYSKVPKFIRKFLGYFAYYLPNIKGKNFLINGSKTIEERFIGNAHIFKDQRERKKLLKNSSLAKRPQEITKKFYDKVADKDDITKMQYLDINMWLQGDILLKADKMSMAHSLELRVPFLDKEIMGVASKIPLKYRIQGKQTKVALRRASSKMLPKITAEKKKLGFPVPIREWLKQEKYINIVSEAFATPCAEKFFNVDYLMKLLKEHYKLKKDNSRKIWTIYTFIIWYHQFFEER